MSKTNSNDLNSLNIDKSFLGKSWVNFSFDDISIREIKNSFNVSELLASILSLKGFDSIELKNFLDPKIRNLMPDPNLFSDMSKAVDRIVLAIQKNEKICIFGDYDVDGATSSALLISFFNHIKVNVTSYIPDRIKEGYGPNSRAMKDISDNGHSVVITVDCGITAFEALDDAGKFGLDVIVIDHHKVESRLPRAIAVVNPKRHDDKSNLDYLAAVGVVFMFIVALNSTLDKIGWYLNTNTQKPDLMQWLDLVALGTVCDVVPLKKLNRALVKQGLSVMSLRKNKGINALCDIVNVSGAISSGDVGFKIGPRINAGGRVGEASLGTRLLSSKSGDEAFSLALRLDEYNSNRKEVENNVFNEAIEQIEKNKSPNDKFILVSNNNWHPGVIGIVASRLKEKYNLPTIVVAIDGGMSKGSCRSVVGIDLGQIIHLAAKKDIIFSGGGHAMAAGFTVLEENLSTLEKFLGMEIEHQVSESMSNPILTISSIISSHGLNNSLLGELKLLEPFGSENEEPRIAVVFANITKATLVGGKHVKCFISAKNGKYINAIAFNSVDTELGKALLDTCGRELHLAGIVRENLWRNKSEVQFIIEDGAWA
ncbi:MAG: single-stranded-DNA-specific exonuclease RecJ [Alphaproteobacteria bacterium TMED87]|nr:single-stranded-DNA-specific exonuclease RecJ [Rhodospirillaceae bacterium]OUV09700.1 MAG: single-stranded-DNA-specific exonuclease RecJ [Alphaproteobacteria bacterium TMED87]